MGMSKYQEDETQPTKPGQEQQSEETTPSGGKESE